MAEGPRKTSRLPATWVITNPIQTTPVVPMRIFFPTVVTGSPGRMARLYLSEPTSRHPASLANVLIADGRCSSM